MAAARVVVDPMSAPSDMPASADAVRRRDPARTARGDSAQLSGRRRGLRVATAVLFASLSVACTSGDVGDPVVGPPADAGATRPRADGGDAAIDAGPSRVPPVMEPPLSDAGRPDAARADASPEPGDAGSVEPVDAAPPPPPPPTVGFDPPSRGFTAAFDLELTAGDPGAALHFTLDGSVPTASSPRATGPVRIGTTTLVRAVAVKNGSASAVFDQLYLALDPSVQSFSSNLPIVVVHMLGAAAPVASDRTYVPSTLALFARDGQRSVLEGPAQHTSRLGIKVRGRSTRNQAKPSYTLELWGHLEEDAPAALAGMPADGDWVLYAPFDWDRSMMHNVFAYDLSRAIGRYAPRTRYCEVFLVAGGDEVATASYAGVYVLTERLTRSPERVAIEELDAKDVTAPALTGGYIVKVDEPDTGAESFTAAGLTFVYVEPDADDIVPAQRQYLIEYLDACKRAVGAPDGRDPTTGKHFRELIDVPSFIDHHILSMLLKNPDAFSLSSHFFKPRDGKLFAGPLWDFDLAMGAIDPWGDRSLNPEHWGPKESSGMFRRSFWGDLFDHPEFTSAYWARFGELLDSAFTSAKFRATIDAFEAQVSEAELRNRARWPESTPREASYVTEIDALQTWLDARLSWVRAQQGMVPP